MTDDKKPDDKSVEEPSKAPSSNESSSNEKLSSENKSNTDPSSVTSVKLSATLDMSEDKTNMSTKTPSTENSAKSSDTKSSANTSSSAKTNLTEKKPVQKTPTETSSTKSSSAKNESKSPVNKAEHTKTGTKTGARASERVKEKPQKSGKGIAIIALLIALCAVGGVGGLFYWQQQQATQNNLVLEQKLVTQLETKLQANTNNLQNTLQGYEQQTQQVLNNMAASIHEASVERIEQLEEAIARLGQNQPSDWLIHEAEYLVRVASRTLWLEKDTNAAITLLTDADNRLKELNSPEYLPTRQLIHQDIEQLRLIPVIDNESIMLKLMALSHQVDDLVISEAHIEIAEEAAEDVVLSENASDWQENLQKTLANFAKQFLTISRREGSVEPLLLPKHQENLRQNLKLKIQVALWALSEEKFVLYKSSLKDVQAWLSEYFDMESLFNQGFSDAISTAANERVEVSYPTKLNSLKALRDILESKSTKLEALESAKPVSAAEIQKVAETQKPDAEAEAQNDVNKLEDEKNAPEDDNQ